MLTSENIRRQVERGVIVSGIGYDHQTVQLPSNSDIKYQLCKL